MQRIYSIPALLFVLMFAVASCIQKDTDADGIADDKDKCPKVFAETADGCPVAEVQIGKVHWFVETSASMGGYFSGSTNFKRVITDLVNKIDKNVKPVDIWYTAETSTRYPYGAAKFSEQIATTKIADKKSSQLHKIFRDVASKTAAGEVSLVVSDLIMSFPDEDVKRKPEINKEEAPTTLKNQMFATFADLKKKGMATSVYAFTSEFNGTYYDYRNGKKQLTNAKRPFYIWVIADKKVLAKFNAELANISTFQPVKELHFGLAEEPVNQAAIMPGLARTGKWTKKSDAELNDVSNGDAFCVMLNLAALPPYAQNKKYLQDNLVIDKQYCEIGYVDVKEKKDLDASKVTAPKQRQQFENATHGFIVGVKSISVSPAKVRLALPLKYDTWYEQWSTDDDRNLATVPNKTFALKHLIDGVKEAYESKNNHYIDVAITLNK